MTKYELTRLLDWIYDRLKADGYPYAAELIRQAKDELKRNKT